MDHPGTKFYNIWVLDGYTEGGDGTDETSSGEKRERIK